MIYQLYLSILLPKVDTKQRLDAIEERLVRQLIHSNRSCDRQIVLAVSRIMQGKGITPIKQL